MSKDHPHLGAEAQSVLFELEQYKILAELDDAIRPLVDSEEITHTAATILGRHLGVNRCAYAYVDPDLSSFTVTGNFTDGVANIAGEYESAAFGTEFVRQSQLGVPYIVEDAETDDRVGDVRQAYRQTQIRAVISVPILKAGKFVAGMAVHQAVPRRWREHEIKLVRSVAERCWESIERSRIAEELRKAEERIRRSHDYLRLLINCTEEGFYSVDREGVTIMCNAAFLRMLGFQREEDAIGKKLHDIIHHSHPDGSHYQVADCPIYLAAKDGKPAYVQDEMFFRQDGSRFPVEYRVQPVWRNEKLEGAVCTFIDLTARKNTEKALQKSQAHLQSLFEQTAAGHCETDLTGLILRVNDRFCQIVGRTRENLLNLRMQDITHPDDLSQNMSLFKKAITCGEPFEIEKRYVRPDGTSVWVNNSVSLIRTAGEEPSSTILAVTLDISARKRAEEALRDADRRKDEFLAMLAHELRNPMAPILAAADLMEVAQLDEEQVKQTSKIISRQVRHMTGLVDDLLDVSRVTRGLVKLVKVDLNVKHVIAGAIEQVRPLLEGKRHRLTLDLDPEPAHVMGDRKRLVQILTNLLNNAAKFTPEGGSLHVTMQAPDGRVILRVSDNGIGISPDLHPRIFDLFTQGERSSDRTQGGLGIGLSLEKSLVEMHAGTVTFHSEGIGRGSEFIVSLPRLMQQEELTPKQQEMGRIIATGRKRRILVVDDNIDAAQMLAMYLQVAGHEVFIEHSSQRGWERAKMESPEVCILDIGLPEMDGNELARRLRAEPATAKAVLIAVTGYAQEQDIERALASGFDHHFAKPVDAGKLLVWIS
ncbi:PAS domain S-box protein [Herbaspirillum sp. GCM10030257]|uniref:PAS domain S-box protein n=1 Tax=Herbaspirillum sp. GCM10030257 TaxID=3273393 RepID=UPI003612C7E0